MRRFILYSIPILILAIFCVIMNAGLYLKNTLGEEDHHFIDYCDKIKANITDGHWEKAESNFKELEETWKKKIPRIQFSVERDQINGIDISLARLKGYLEAQDKAGALAELYEARRHWTDLGR